MRKALFIYNPLSGDHKLANKLDHVIKRFQSRNILLHPYRLYNESGDGFRGFEDNFVEIIRNEKYDFTVVCGGDGTLNYVVNVILRNNLDIPVGVIPSGTCNDFARCLGIPSTLDKGLDIILSGNILEVDVGLLNEEQYFLSSCAGGLFVDVSYSTNNDLKKNFGPFAYYLKALSEMASIKPFRIKLQTDSEIVEEDVLLFLVLNGKHVAGLTNLIKHADFTDGLMDIVLIKSCSHIDLASMFFNVLSKAPLNNKQVATFMTKTCSIEGPEGLFLSVDGEKSTDLPINVRFINRALKVFSK